MRVLITGAAGLLGSKLLAAAPERFHLIALSRHTDASFPAHAQWHQADVRDRQAIHAIIHSEHPDAIIHAAAMTDVDACELHPQDAWETNVDGTDHLARAASDVGAYLVLLSTDYVFPGDAGPYAENDPPGPPGSVYGRTKLAAEQIVLDRCPDAGIARTSLLYGYAPRVRTNFVTWVAGRLARGETAPVVVDQVGSPTLADNLAQMVLAMVSQRAGGVFHTAGPEWMSRLEYATRVAGCFGLDASLLVPTDTPTLKLPAPRPPHSGLLVTRVPAELGVRPVGLDEGLMTMRAQFSPSD